MATYNLPIGSGLSVKISGTILLFSLEKNIQKISKNKVLLKMYLIVILISFIAEISA